LKEHVPSIFRAKEYAKATKHHETGSFAYSSTLKDGDDMFLQNIN
jgi:hypothetical protein